MREYDTILLLAPSGLAREDEVARVVGAREGGRADEVRFGVHVKNGKERLLQD